MFIENRMTTRPSAERLAALAAHQVTTWGHRTDFGFVSGLSAMREYPRVAGPAVTVQIPHLDSTAVQCALDHIEPGDVLVIQQSGERGRSCFGGTLAYAAWRAGAAAVVIDGHVNDRSELLALELPIFARGYTAKTTRVLGIEGAINVPVSVGGVGIAPGDIVFADEDGIAVLSPERLDAVTEIIATIEQKAAERDILALLDGGERLSELTGARALLQAGLVSGGAR